MPTYYGFKTSTSFFTEMNESSYRIFIAFFQTYYDDAHHFVEQTWTLSGPADGCLNVEALHVEKVHHDKNKTKPVSRAPWWRSWRGDCGRHSCLAVYVLGFTDVVTEVDSLHVLHRQDALGDPGGVAHASVHQPPQRLDVNRTLVLQQHKHSAFVGCRGVKCF